MELTRRNFLKFTAATGTVGMTGAARKASAFSEKTHSSDWLGVLVDTTVCIGCRKCEWACNNVNQLSQKSISEFEDKSVFKTMRRPDESAYTVVNEYENPDNPQLPYHVKVQCMHCNEAACVSACIVGALTKHQDTGAVHYDAWKCIGCRYCMAACPFQIPAYEYNNALTPQVRKCTFCFDRINQEGGIPGCVEICPVEALTFGKRSDLIKLAREKISREPEKYVDHIYGEHELGGTSWMYLSGRPMEEMDMERFGEKPIPSYTEPLQHAIFKNFVPPLSLFAFLGIIMKLFKNHDEANLKEGGSK